MASANDLISQYLGGAGTAGFASNLPGANSLGLGQVYMGQEYTTGDVDPRQRGAVKTRQDKYMGVNEANALPAQWSQSELSDFVNAGVLKKIPGFNQNMGLPEVLSQWNDLVKLSTNLGQQGIKMSPWDLMNTYQNRGPSTYKRGNWIYDSETNQPIQYVGPTERTDTSQRVDLSTREDALALAKNSMAQLLGRAPTADEVSQYLNALNGYERENPTVSTTVTHISPETGEQTGSETTSSGGVTQAGRQALLEQKMEGTKEYGAYQASTTYFNAMMQLLARGY